MGNYPAPFKSKALNAFFAKLEKTKRGILMLDYDGTLSPFKVKRETAFPYPGVKERLRLFAAHPSLRTIIISGRTVKDLLNLLQEVSPLPELWGSYGLERCFRDGTYRKEKIDKETAQRLKAAKSMGDEIVGPDRCEKKPFGVALHTRGLPKCEAERMKEEAEKRWHSLCQGSDVSLYSFDGGLEIRMRGKDKGDVVSKILQEVKEASAVAYLGDDVADEEAFDALGTGGLKILVRAEPRETLADICLRPPHEVLEFFDQCIAILKTRVQKEGKG